MPELKVDIPKDYLLGLHWAAMTGNVGLVKFALDNGAPTDAVLNGFMPLQLACLSDNNLAVVQYLIDRGADVNAQRWSKKHSADKSQAVAGAIGSTALHVACANGCTRVVDLLLRNGANVDVKDKYGLSPFDIAAAKNHVEIVRLFEGLKRQERRKKTAGSGHPEHRHSMVVMVPDAPSATQRFRRPSLPSDLESQSHVQPQTSDVVVPKADPIAPRQSLNLPRPKEIPGNRATAFDIHKQPSPHSITPELSSSKSSSDSTCEDMPIGATETSVPTSWTTDSERRDWYGHGVVNHYGGESYLSSLERRAYGLDDTEGVGRRSLDQRSRPVEESLKRCSSDGGYLRTKALMNAMATKDTVAGQEQEPEPRPSIVIDDVTEADAFRSSLKERTKPILGRKSLDVAILQHTQPSEPRRSLDIRPNLDTLSSLAKRSLDGLSRRSLDIHAGERPVITDPYINAPRPSFLSRIVDAWSKK